MENNSQNPITETVTPNSTPQVTAPNTTETTRITFTNRYLHLSEPHNRVNRTTFLINIIILELLVAFLPSSIFVTLGFLLFYFVQVTKRFHDFGKSWHWAAWVIAYRIILFFGPYLYFILTSENALSGAFAYAFFMFKYGLIITLFSVIPDIILALIPGDKETNKYGKPQVM